MATSGMQYISIKRSPQLPMLMASDVDIREVESLNTEVLDILTHIIGARAVRIWQHPIRISATFWYYLLSLLSDRHSPGQGFCGIQMWFPMLDDNSIYGSVFKLVLDPTRTLSPQEFRSRRENFMLFTISCMEAWMPYIGFAVHKSMLSIKQLVITVTSDDSDEASDIAQNTALQGGSEDESMNPPRERQVGSPNPSHAADYAGSSSAIKWLYKFSAGLRESQSDPNFKWAGSLFTHSHLLLFLVYGVYFSPVLRLHSVRLINAIKMGTNSHPKDSGRAHTKMGVQDRINLKVLAWLVGGRLGLLAMYGAYRWYQESQGHGSLENSSHEPITVDSASVREYQASLASQAGRERTGVDASHPNEMKKRQCPLCVDSIKDPLVTRCGHVYCHNCLFDMMRRTNPNLLDASHRHRFPCPICRKEFLIQELRHLYTK